MRLRSWMAGSCWTMAAWTRRHPGSVQQVNSRSWLLYMGALETGACRRAAQLLRGQGLQLHLCACVHCQQHHIHGAEGLCVCLRAAAWITFS
jgi:hypothetical protein